MERGYQRQVRVCCRAIIQNDRTAGSHGYESLLVPVAITLWALLFVLVASIGGCTRPERHATSLPCGVGQAAYYKNIRFVPVLVQASEQPRPSLIFPADPALTPIPAEAFTRADWPTAQGRYDAGQTVNYQEYSYDTQGLSANSPSYGYRTFTTQRNGMQTGP